MPQPQTSAEVRVLPDAAAIARRAAEILVDAAAQAVSEKGSFELVLSGGSTPKALHSLLVSDPTFRSRMPWDKTHIFFGDERHVPPTDARSNYRMAFETLISKSPLKPEQVTRVKAELPSAADAALDYESELRRHFRLAEAQFPRFDLILLGMGSEGHTASLFPGTKALHENRRIVVHNWVGKVLMDRITLTAPAINNSRRVLFLVSGADKCLALTAVLERAFEPDQLPAQLIRPANGSLLWLVDAAAGGQLTHATRE
ncbi:MAG TPA: 6-phosphogluconolactonase [Candidatus Acidoferrum sp.]|nr:6-phosphogluconolactonase [Candidatus Acidoferrum sp.]